MESVAYSVTRGEKEDVERVIEEIIERLDMMERHLAEYEEKVAEVTANASVT